MILLLYDDGEVFQFDGEPEDFNCSITREGEVKIIRYNSEYSLRRMDSPSFQLYNAVKDVWVNVPDI